MKIIIADKHFSEFDINNELSLDIRNINAKNWVKLINICQATDLKLYHLTIDSINGIEQLSTITDLTIEWANKIDRIDPIYKIPYLKKLTIFDFPKLRDLGDIQTLQHLYELNLSGNRGSLTPALCLSTIEPVSRISNLTSFSLTVAKLLDDDITILSKCTKLQNLNLSNQFDRDQFAFLAKKLNGQLKEPIEPYKESVITCEKCGRDKFMFTGRRMPILCSNCDNAKFNKYHSQFMEKMNKYSI